MKRPKKRPTVRRHYTLLHELLASPTEPLSAAHQMHQLTRMWLGLAALETAAAPSTDDWRVCSDAINLMETLVLEMRAADDRHGLLADAVAALAKAGKRHRAGGHIRLDAQGILAVRAVLEDYAAAIAQMPARTMIRCHRLTEARIASILAGKRLPHDVEVMDL